METHSSIVRLHFLFRSTLTPTVKPLLSASFPAESGAGCWLRLSMRFQGGEKDGDGEKRVLSQAPSQLLGIL
jgi:hypothetical protein